jgi:flavin-dependent dehydrogenase
MQPTKKVDIIVIGAGPAGIVASTYLQQKGLEVLVIEKSKFPRFVIGESLLPKCMDNFREVGLLTYLEKQNYQLKNGVAFIRDGVESIFDFSEQFTKGQTFTWQVPRADFDNVLAEGAQELGVKIMFETGVTAVEINDNSQLITIEDKDGSVSQLESKYLIDSSGHGRVLPRLLDLDDDTTLPVRTTIFAHIHDGNRQNYMENINYITYLVHDDHYVWNIPFANGNTSMGIVGANEVFDVKEGSLADKYKQLIADEPYLTERYGDQELVFEPRMLKGFSTGVKKLYGKGFVLTGNATEFLDPIFSSGVTLATESGLKAAKLVEKELNGEIVDWETEYEAYVRFGVDVFKTYVNAWYDTSLHSIFFAKNQQEEVRKQICSILAGYVWDRTNPCVNRYKTILQTLKKVIEIQS